MVTIALLGTLDTKLEEFLKLRELVLAAGAKEVVLVDAGRKHVQHPAITVSHPELIKTYSEEATSSVRKPDFDSASRGEIVGYLAHCAISCVQKLYQQGRIHGILSAGGSGGTSLATAAMRALPIGFPKAMVSTVGSGDISPFVGETDICMMYSVVDIAGWNGMLEDVFTNAAGSIVGMAQAAMMRSQQRFGAADKIKKWRIGITMFGVTTPCVDMIREELTQTGDTEVYVFHATGHGGKAMERLVEAGQLDAVIDLTTTEICDLLIGGNMSAGERRLEAALKAGIPYVISAGALDIVNFGARNTVPEKYQQRNLYEHNAAVTLMRTTPDECRQIGEFISNKILSFSKDIAKVRIILPEGGMSLISTPGQAFHDPKADTVLFDAISISDSQHVHSSYPKIVRRPEAINDENFAKAVVQTLKDIHHG